jgi:hypothetical protein
MNLLGQALTRLHHQREHDHPFHLIMRKHVVEWMWTQHTLNVEISDIPMAGHDQVYKCNR